MYFVVNFHIMYTIYSCRKNWLKRILFENEKKSGNVAPLKMCETASLMAGSNKVPPPLSVCSLLCSLDPA